MAEKASQLYPVEHDPFEVSLVPVDHDPFLISVPAVSDITPDPMKLGGGQESSAERALRVGIEAAGGFDVARAIGAGRQVVPQLERGETGRAIGSGLEALGYGTLGLAGMAMPGRGKAAQAAVEAAAPVKNALRVYHGSPYDFPAFDYSKIGTGEGHQAYGHGLYFAERPEVAETYRYLKAPLGQDAYTAAVAKHALKQATDAGLTGEEARKSALNWLDEKGRSYKTNVGQVYYDALNNFDSIVTKPPGKAYEVAINADPEHFLDWDKPISQQSEHVRKALDTLITPEERARRARWTPPSWSDHPKDARYDDTVTGATLYESNHLVPGEYRDPGAASQRLREAGIAGIRYADQGSRGASGGTSNYVVFDDKTIEILRKYGLLGLIGGGAAAGLSGEAEASPASAAAKAAKAMAAPAIRRGDTPLFDYSRLSAISGPQFDLPRYVPPKGVPERTQALTEPSNVARVNEVVERGLGGAEWYGTQPLREAFIEQRGAVEGEKAFQTYMDFVAATSPEMKVPYNIRTASYYNYLAAQGLPVPPKPESPYGAKAQNLHRQNALRLMEEGGWDVYRNPKPASFAQNLMGNLQPVTVDRHNVRLWGVTDTLGRPVDLPSKNEYGFLETLQQAEAAKMGIAPGQYQAAAWLGGAKETGVKSGVDPFLKIFEDRVRITAEKRGETPHDTLKKFISGAAPLLSVGGAAVLVPIDYDPFAEQ